MDKKWVCGTPTVWTNNALEKKSPIEGDEWRKVEKKVEQLSNEKTSSLSLDEHKSPVAGFSDLQDLWTADSTKISATARLAA